LETDEKAKIESQAFCVDSPGIAIPDVDDANVRLACLQDPKVQSACNFDGQHARLKAFQRWQSALMAYQQQCEQRNGHFSFADPVFQEPSDESFCHAAEPIVEYGMFENPICNFVSRCPTVAVVCRVHEELPSMNVTKTVSLPGVPMPVFLSY
jgi:hypothetical protein